MPNGGKGNQETGLIKLVSNERAPESCFALKDDLLCLTLCESKKSPGACRGFWLVNPKDDGHKVFVVLTREPTEIGIELAVANVDEECVVVTALLVRLLPDTADFDAATTGRPGAELKDRSLGVAAMSLLIGVIWKKTNQRKIAIRLRPDSAACMNSLRQYGHATGSQCVKSHCSNRDANRPCRRHRKPVPSPRNDRVFS